MAEEKQVKAKAIHAINHGKGTIDPGKHFAAGKSEVDRLVALGAAELVAAELKPAPTPPVESDEDKAAREAAELAGKSK